MAEEEAEAANYVKQSGTSPPTSPSKRIRLAHEATNVEEATAEEEAPVIRREASSPAASPPQYLPRKLCKRFSTPQGCPFGNSCRFAHIPGSEHFCPRFVNNYKACTKFISTLGCPYGERCNFWHSWPKGVTARVDTDLGNNPNTSNANRSRALPKMRENREDYKSRLCSWFGSATGCRYGEKCHFAHGEEEVKRSEVGISGGMYVSAPGSNDLVKGGWHVNDKVKMEENTEKKESMDMPSDPDPVRLVCQPTRTGAHAFGSSTKSMISIDAKLAGPIIGTSGMHTKHIRRLTGAKVLILENESDPNLKVVEVEGSFEQVKQASVMVREVLYHALRRPPLFYTHSHKSKICEKFPQGLCRFGNHCRFVHVARQEAHTKPSCSEA